MIEYVNNNFHLTGKNFSYIISITDKGYVQNSYYGKKIKFVNTEIYKPYLRDYNVVTSDGVPLDYVQLEYSQKGYGDNREGAYKVLNEDDNLLSRLYFKDYEIISGKKKLDNLPCAMSDNAKTLNIRCIDEIIGLEVILSYSVFENTNIICRNAKFVNTGKRKLILKRAYSASVDFPQCNYEVVYLGGSWGRETQINKQKLQYGKFEISASRGSSSHQLNPFLALCENNANENYGNVYGFLLNYSGNHSIVCEVDQYSTTRIISGINPDGFSWNLNTNETFQTPECVMCFSDSGLGGLSREYHRFINKNIRGGGRKIEKMPILINSWESTYFDFNETKLLDIAKKSKDIGIEMFVLDDGWFGKRNSDKTSLGDWDVNLEKLPNGINGLCEKINNMGLKFGLWLEPEMISPDSELYKNNPHWAVACKNRDETLGRNQLILDITKNEIKEFIINTVTQILNSCNIEYIKWDMNRNMSDIPYEGYNHKYYLALYEILDVITNKFPQVIFESCAGGGGRYDVGMLYYMPYAWISDNTDAMDRLKIQYGASLCYPIQSMGTHVTVVPNHQTNRMTKMETRRDVAFFGTYGYELDPTKLSAEEISNIKNHINVFKDYQDVILNGDFIRLENPFEGNFCSWCLVSENEMLLLSARILAMPNFRESIIKLVNLEENTIYKDTKTNKLYSGSELMYKGIRINYGGGDFITQLIHFEKHDRSN